jgi:hypothetical protein
MAVLAEIACLFNRLIVSLLSLAAIVVALSVLVSPERALATAQANLAALQSAPVASLVGLAIVVGLVAIALLLAEMLPWRLPPVYQAAVNGGLVEYPASLVAALISRELTSLDGVRGARVKVQGTRSRVDVAIRVTLREDDDCHDIAGRAIESVRSKVTGLGLEIGQILLTVRTTRDCEAAPQRRRFAFRKA